MEVILEAVSGQAVPEDTFVSIRIGDVHKQTRFVASRAHRFPEGCAREGFARIEVFKRLGTAIVDFQGNEVGDYLCAAAPVDVDCDYPGLSKLSWQLSVKRPLAAGSPVKAPTAASERKQPIQRLNSAQQYLRDNNLEVHLANVVQELLKVRPKDPHAFVSSRMNDLRDRPPSGGMVLPPLPRKGATQDLEQRLGDSMPPAVPPKSLPPIQRRDLSPAGIRKARDLSPAGLKSVKSVPSLPPNGGSRIGQASGSRAGTPSQGVAHVTDKENLYSLFPEAAHTKERDHRSKPVAVVAVVPVAVFSNSDFETTMRAQHALGWVGAAELEKTPVVVSATEEDQRLKPTGTTAADAAPAKEEGQDLQAFSKGLDRLEQGIDRLEQAASNNRPLPECPNGQRWKNWFHLEQMCLGNKGAMDGGMMVGAGTMGLEPCEFCLAAYKAAQSKAVPTQPEDLDSKPPAAQAGNTEASDALASTLPASELEDAKGKARDALCAALCPLPGGELEDAKGKARDALCAALCPLPGGELEDAKGKARDALCAALCPLPGGELEDAKGKARDALCAALCPLPGGELESVPSTLDSAKEKAREALCAALFADDETKSKVVSDLSASAFESSMRAQHASGWVEAAELEKKQEAKQIRPSSLALPAPSMIARSLSANVQLSSPSGGPLKLDIGAAPLSFGGAGQVAAVAMRWQASPAQDTIVSRTPFKAPMRVEDFNTNFDSPIATFARQLYSLFPNIERVAEKSRLGVKPLEKPLAPIPESVASIRSQVKSSLLQGVRDGRLAEAIKSDDQPPDVASTKLAVKTLLVKAARDGSLAESIEDNLARTLLPKELPPAPPPREVTTPGIAPGDTASAAETAAKQIPQRTGLLPSAPSSGEPPGIRSRTVVLESAPLMDSSSSPSAPGSPDLRSRTALLLLPPPEVARMVPLTGPAEYAPTRLRVVIQRATGLRDADVMTLSDPYCVLEVRGPNQTLHRRFHTKVIDNDLYPIWNEKYDFDYEKGDELSFSIWNKDSVKSDDFLGFVNLSADLFLPNGFEGHVVLSDCGVQWWLDEARLYLKIRPVPGPSSPSSTAQAPLQPSLTTSATLA